MFKNIYNADHEKGVEMVMTSEMFYFLKYRLIHCAF